MESAKLTLRLDKQVIERGKVYAKEQGTSLSKLFEHFLREVTPPPVDKKERYIDPYVRSLMFNSGETGTGQNKDYYEEYFNHVSTKHLREEE